MRLSHDCCVSATLAGLVVVFRQVQAPACLLMMIVELIAFGGCLCLLQPKEIGLPFTAYTAIDEVREVSYSTFELCGCPSLHRGQ